MMGGRGVTSLLRDPRDQAQVQTILSIAVIKMSKAWMIIFVKLFSAFSNFISDVIDIQYLGLAESKSDNFSSTI